MTWVRLRLSMVPVWLEKTALSSCCQRPVSSFSASMEMNESSRWTEEEMETAKKGERCLGALMALDLHLGPPGSVVGRTLTHWAVLGSPVVWGGRLCFWALLKLVTSPWGLSFALQKMGLCATSGSTWCCWVTGHAVHPVSARLPAGPAHPALVGRAAAVHMGTSGEMQSLLAATWVQRVQLYPPQLLHLGGG